MLFHPCLSKDLPTVPGTRILQETFGLVGLRVVDPTNPLRLWTVHSLYAPIIKRRLGGIRVKLVDDKRFVTFCNQRDFEVLIDLAKPGTWCQWAAQDYPKPGDDEWFGFCMDDVDLADDLYERELMLVAEHPQGIDYTANISRRIHTDARQDFEDYWIPANSGTGANGLDSLVLLYRWIRISKDRIDWRKVL
jgi:hypothetical protein